MSCLLNQRKEKAGKKQILWRWDNAFCHDNFLPFTIVSDENHSLEGGIGTVTCRSENIHPLLLCIRGLTMLKRQAEVRRDNLRPSLTDFWGLPPQYSA